MSHDQKPGKVRVVGGGSGGGGGVPQRRQQDETPVVAGSAAAAEPVEAPEKSKRLLPMLFVSGCALGGAGLPLLRVL